MSRFSVRLSAALFMIVMAAAGPASAHTTLVRTDPADGARLTSAPRTVTLEFSENIGRGHVAVTAPDGTRVKTADVRTLDHTLRAAVAPGDQRGRYTVAYRVVSADGHPVIGTFTFTTTTGRSVTQVEVDATPDDSSFVHRHRSHLLLGIGAAAVAIGLILAPLRHRGSR